MRITYRHEISLTFLQQQKNISKEHAEIQIVFHPSGEAVWFPLFYVLNITEYMC